jgi:hypothetical protein
VTLALRSPRLPWPAERRRALAVAPMAVLLALVAGAFAGLLAAQQSPLAIVAFALVPVPLVLWRWPHAAILITLVGTTTIEQFTYDVTANVKGAWTQSIPFFRSLSPGTGISPMEIFLVVVLVIWLLHGALRRSLQVPRTPLAKMIAIYLALVTAFVGLGLSRGGRLNMVMWEARPWFYLGVMFVLASTLLTSKRALHALLWIVVLGSGFKAVQGAEIFLAVRHVTPRPEATLAHEEAFFFGLFTVLTAALWIFRMRGRLRVTATLLLPIVTIANLGNSRRNAWAILALELVVLLVLAWFRLPERRPMLRRLIACMLVVGAVYFPTFWNNDGAVGQPARALRSAIAPSARDLMSNQYRQAEDANLVLNIQASNGVGKGFGVPIDYAIPITDLSHLSSAIDFVPHNGVLYVWMRMGLLGEIALFSLIGAMIMRACQLVKVADRELALFGAVVVCAVVGYVVQGYNDMGFFWFRIAIGMGILLGAVEAALRFAPTNSTGAEPSGVLP